MNTLVFVEWGHGRLMVERSVDIIPRTSEIPTFAVTSNLYVTLSETVILSDCILMGAQSRSLNNSHCVRRAGNRSRENTARASQGPADTFLTLTVFYSVQMVKVAFGAETAQLNLR